MAKIGRPRGLIDYATLDDAGRRKGRRRLPRRCSRRCFRPRTIIYFAIWVSIGLAMLFTLGQRTRLDIIAAAGSQSASRARCPTARSATATRSRCATWKHGRAQVDADASTVCPGRVMWTRCGRPRNCRPAASRSIWPPMPTTKLRLFVAAPPAPAEEHSRLHGWSPVRRSARPAAAKPGGAGRRQSSNGQDRPMRQATMSRHSPAAHMTAIMVGFFGVVMAVNFTMARFASRHLWRHRGRQQLCRQPEVQRLAGRRRAAQQGRWAGGPTPVLAAIAMRCCVVTAARHGFAATGTAQHPLWPRAPMCRSASSADADGHLRVRPAVAAGPLAGAAAACSAASEADAAGGARCSEPPRRRCHRCTAAAPTRRFRGAGHALRRLHLQAREQRLAALHRHRCGTRQLHRQAGAGHASCPTLDIRRPGRRPLPIWASRRSRSATHWRRPMREARQLLRAHGGGGLCRDEHHAAVGVGLVGRRPARRATCSTGCRR